MLTFEAIRGIARKEQTSTKLIELPGDFFPQTRAYLEKKGKMKRDEDAWELNSAKQQLEDLINRREAKIVQAALQFVHSEVRPDNMAPEERWLFDSLVEQAILRIEDITPHHSHTDRRGHDGQKVHGAKKGLKSIVNRLNQGGKGQCDG